MSGTEDGAPLPAEAVVWAIRLLLGREPAGDWEVTALQRQPSIEALRLSLSERPEFDALAWHAPRRRPRYGVPPAMLRPPANGELPWRFVPPTLEYPVTQLCTASQFAEPAFEEIATALGAQVLHHRGIWEHVYIVSALATEGLVAPGRRAIGFGCGAERIPALLASRGVAVLASDRLPDGAAQLDAMFDARILPREDYDRLVHYHPIDMEALPEGVDGQFDMLWSASAVQHLGGARQATDFIERSLALLRPGGLAVHTTDFDLGLADVAPETYDVPALRRLDIEGLGSRLGAQGHEILPINLHPGERKEDSHIDVPPYGLPHLKLVFGRHVLTSIGIAVRRKR